METVFTGLANYLLIVIQATFSQCVILLAPGLVMALGMYFISSLTRKQAAEVFGYKFFVYFTALGTIIHELGHAFFAILFGHRIISINLFGPDDNGMLGYVKHAYNPKNIYQLIGNFFIGIGPILFGSLVIFLSSYLLLGPDVFQPLQNIQSFNSIRDLQSIALQSLTLLKQLLRPENFTGISFYLFIYIVFAVGSHIKLSPTDLQSAWSGFVILVGLLFLLNLATAWAGDFLLKAFGSLSQAFSFFYALMLFTVILNLLFLAVLFFILILKRLVRR